MARIKFSLLAGASASQRRVLLAVGRGATEAVVRGKGTSDGGLLGAPQGALQLAPETRPRSPRPPPPALLVCDADAVPGGGGRSCARDAQAGDWGYDCPPSGLRGAAC